MVRIAPIRLSFNPKTLWFDAGDFELPVGQSVVVETARGLEYGVVSSSVFDMEYEETKKLKSPLKPVKRLATDEDGERVDECIAKTSEALPVFRRLAAETVPDMNPIAVEYLFEGGKAIFYFDSEERVDFRDLVRQLAHELHVRVDMKQIGVRDGARMVGGLGHCGQELCCRRLGGEFKPVSIRMAKEQDLSLNPQKISGICGRLMCCLRYEFDAYKDFHSRAPKKNAKIHTPDGDGKVVDLDVPREIVSVKVGDEKPVKVPLADFEEANEGERPNTIGDEAWERANEPALSSLDSAIGLFATTELSGEDKLAQPGKVRHVHEEKTDKKPGRSRSRRRGGSSGGVQDEAKASSSGRKPRRRRSTTVKSDGSTETANNVKGAGKQASQKDDSRQKQPRRRRSRSSSGSQQQGASSEKQQRSTQVGRNSSSLRSNRPNDKAGKGQQGKKENASRGSKAESQSPSKSGQGSRRRRRGHRGGSSSSTESKPKTE